jgi:hypothetical protein
MTQRAHCSLRLRRPTKCSAYLGGKDQEGPGKANVVADALSRKSYEKAVPKSAQLQEEMARLTCTLFPKATSAY